MKRAMIFALLMPTSAWAGDLSAGWFALNDPMVDGVFLGGEPAVGYRHHLSGPLSFEGRIGYAPDTGEERASSLTRTLVFIADLGSGDVDFQQPLVVNTWRVELLADLGPERARDRLQGVPHLRGGIAIEGQQGYNAFYDDSSETYMRLDSTGAQIGVPVIAEFTHELWGSRGFGMRFSAGVLVEIRDKPQYDPDQPVTESELYTRPRIGIDLLFDVGGES